MCFLHSLLIDSNHLLGRAESIFYRAIKVIKLRGGSMPINRKKMKALKDEYGKEHGEQVYYALENEAKSGKMPKKKKKSKKN